MGTVTGILLEFYNLDEAMTVYDKMMKETHLVKEVCEAQCEDGKIE